MAPDSPIPHDRPNEQSHPWSSAHIGRAALVRNLLGEIIFSEATSQGNIAVDLSQQPAGMYLLEGIENNKKEIEKIILQK